MSAQQLLCVLAVLSVALLCAAEAAVAGAQPTVPLHNAAQSGQTMPVIGIGTGAYGNPGEHWNDTVAEAAVLKFLAAGGRRIDTANDYNTQAGIGRAIKKSGVPRSEIFVTSKVGPVLPLGFNTTLEQAAASLTQMGLDYFDLLLMHWPGSRDGSGTTPPSTSCHPDPSVASWKECRVQTWQALEQLYRAGSARAIGVSNFEAKHLQDIFALGGLLPAVNQVEFHLYWHELDLLQFCQQHNIQFNSYAPLGTPDHTVGWWPFSSLNQPTVVEIAQHHGKTPAQVNLRWQLQRGLVVNPRTESEQHMADNLAVFDFNLTEVELAAIEGVPNVGLKNSGKVCPDPSNIV